MAETTVSLGDKSWKFDDKRITLSDAFLIKGATGLALKPFFAGVSEMDPLCLQGLVWFLRRKDGEQVALADIDFVINDLDVTQEPDPPA